MRTITLVSLGFGGVAVATGTGLAISNYVGGETIENYFKNSNKTFLGSITSTDLPAILTAYEKTTRFQPKDDKNQPVKKDNLVSWCNTAIKGNYYGANDKTFKAVDSWCYINNNSFEQELVGIGKTKITEAQSTHADWVNAWDRYSKNQEASKKIDGFEKHNNQKDAGQDALMKWCQGKNSSKMYLDNAKDDFNRFQNWCAK